MGNEQEPSPSSQGPWEGFLGPPELSGSPCPWGIRDGLPSTAQHDPSIFSGRRRDGTSAVDGTFDCHGVDGR